MRTSAPFAALAASAPSTFALHASTFALGASADRSADRSAALAWPQFRGPQGAGVLAEGKLPMQWSAKDNVAWSVEVQGRGWSSPVAWDNTVFVTSGISGGKFKEPSTGIYGNDYVAELVKQGLSEEEVLKRVTARDIELTSDTGEIRYMVCAFDATTGQLKWEREAHRGAPFGGRHADEAVQNWAVDDFRYQISDC